MIMKKIFVYLMALLGTVTAVALEPQRYVLDVKDFAEVKVVDGINVDWRCNADSAGMIVFETTPDKASLIMAENNKNTLKLQLATTEVPVRDLPTLTVYSNFLSKAENSGDSTLNIMTPPPSAEVQVRIIGNGTIIARGLHATTVQAKIDSGQGHIMLQGLTQWLKIRNVGSGTIEAGGLKSENASITMGGTGNIDCWVTEELTVKGLASGTVYCKGNPTVKNRTLGTVKVVNVD